MQIAHLDHPHPSLWDSVLEICIVSYQDKQFNVFYSSVFHYLIIYCTWCENRQYCDIKMTLTAMKLIRNTIPSQSHCLQKACAIN